LNFVIYNVVYLMLCHQSSWKREHISMELISCIKLLGLAFRAYFGHRTYRLIAQHAKIQQVAYLHEYIFQMMAYVKELLTIKLNGML